MEGRFGWTVDHEINAGVITHGERYLIIPFAELTGYCKLRRLLGAMARAAHRLFSIHRLLLNREQSANAREAAIKFKLRYYRRWPPLR